MITIHKWETLSINIHINVETRLIASLRGDGDYVCGGITCDMVIYTDLEIEGTSLNSIINN